MRQRARSVAERLLRSGQRVEDLGRLLDLAPDHDRDLVATTVTAVVALQGAASVLEARASSIASAPSHVDLTTAILHATPARIGMTTDTMIAMIVPTMAMTVLEMTMTISALSLRATAPLCTPEDAGSTETTE